MPIFMCTFSKKVLEHPKWMCFCSMMFILTFERDQWICLWEHMYQFCRQQNKQAMILWLSWLSITSENFPVSADICPVSVLGLVNCKDQIGSNFFADFKSRKFFVSTYLRVSLPRVNENVPEHRLAIITNCSDSNILGNDFLKFFSSHLCNMKLMFYFVCLNWER